MKKLDHTPFLMYHELGRAGRPLCSTDPGYVRYVVGESVFEQHVAHIASLGMRGVSATQWIAQPVSTTPRVVITFDDGCETDLIAAAPILVQRGFGATFYLTVDFLARPGFLTHAQVRELAATGLEIGCHSMSHAYLSDLDNVALHREVVDSKQRLEEIAGVRVRSFSAPGGRYDARLLPLAREAGYDSIATSKAMQNASARPAGLLGRTAITFETTMSQLDATLDGRDLGARQSRDRMLGAAKKVLGNHLYERLRSALLR